MICTIQILAAAPGYGQDREQKLISLRYTHTPIEKVFSAIEKKADVIIMYEKTAVIKDKKVSISVSDMPLAEVMDLLLKDLSLQWSIRGKFIRIENSPAAFGPVGPSPSAKDNIRKDSIYPVFTGKVTDEAGQAIPGASVQVRGSNQGTITDANGSFTFSVSGSRIALRVSFIGYMPVDTVLAVPLNRELLILLSQDVNVLEGVTVSTGYWETSKRLSTGNISKVTAETIEKQPVTNVLQALQGRMPGVEIQEANGLPGSNFAIRIRGTNSLRSNGNFPLLVVDGVPFPTSTLHSSFVVNANLGAHPLNSINPSDIESVEVLKDADATAIYGSRGANGVILIKTKKHKGKGLKIDLSATRGIAYNPARLSLLNTTQWLQMRREAFANDGVAINSSNAPDLVLWDTTRSVNWQKELIGGSAQQFNWQGAIAGGNEQTRFYLRSGYYKETTVYPGDFGYKRGSVQLNAGHQTPSGKFKIEVSTSYTADQNDQPREDLTSKAMGLPPNAPEPFHADGTLNWSNATWNNPYAVLRKPYEGVTSNLVANTVISYKLLKDITLSANLGYNSLAMNESSLSPINSQNPSGTVIAESYFSQHKSTTWIAEPKLEYQRSLKRSRISFLTGVTIQQSTNRSQALRGRGFSSDALMKNISAATEVRVSAFDETIYRYASVYGRIHYAHAEKYLLNITGRRDGSSRFGPERLFGNFFSVGGAWFFSTEPFMSSTNRWLTLGKLRASYGTAGSDQIGDYQYLDTYSTTTYPYQGQPGLYPVRLVNPEFAWEVNRKLEAGMELSLFDNLIELEISAYKNRSSNQLVGYPLPFTTGFSSVQYNMPAVVENTGIELTVDTRILKKKGWEWSMSANLSLPRNKLVSFPGIETTSYVNSYQVGSPISVSKRYKFKEVDPDTGAYLFEDLNGDGKLSADDRYFAPGIAARAFGGIRNTVSYRSWQLDFFVRFVSQNGLGYMSSFSGYPGSRFSNQPDWVLDRWQRPGDLAPVQQFTQSGASAAGRAYNLYVSQSDLVIEDASFIRLQNVSLYKTFRFPHKGGGVIKLFGQGQNLWTWTGYRGLDPETRNSQGLPPLRRFTLGIQFNL